MHIRIIRSIRETGACSHCRVVIDAISQEVVWEGPLAQLQRACPRPARSYHADFFTTTVGDPDEQEVRQIITYTFMCYGGGRWRVIPDPRKRLLPALASWERART